jgi:predicted RNA-binding protein YlxR (DUF448 family)
MTPWRTCIGCRTVRAKGALVRLARRPGGEVVVDAAGGGRGAYLCEDAACLARGLDRGRLRHAFRKPCEVRPTLAEEVRERWQLAR